jgi:hypothetical protein
MGISLKISQQGYPIAPAADKKIQREKSRIAQNRSFSALKLTSTPVPISFKCSMSFAAHHHGHHHHHAHSAVAANRVTA